MNRGGIWGFLRTVNTHIPQMSYLLVNKPISSGVVITILRSTVFEKEMGKEWQTKKEHLKKACFLMFTVQDHG